MENILVCLIVAAALVFIVRGFVKTYKGEGGCGCAGGCTGCHGRDADCCCRCVGGACR